MGIQDRKIGRIPIYFGEYNDASTYYKMNRVTHYGSEFQLRVDSAKGVPPIVFKDGHIDFENSNFSVNNTDPSKTWYIISNATASFDASANIYWLKEYVDASVSATNQRIDNIVDQYLKEVDDNPEFVEVHTDSEDKVLYGVQTDGNFYFGCGVPRQIQEAIPGMDPDIQGYVYYGVNPEATENQSRAVSNSISGVYQVSTAHDASTSTDRNIYFFVPAAVTQFYASINGMTIPFVESSVEIDGKPYKKFESKYTYNEAILNIVLA